MNDLDANLTLLLLGRIEEFVETGVQHDLQYGLLKQWEAEQLLRLARIKFDTPYMFRTYVPLDFFVQEDEVENMGEQSTTQITLVKKPGQLIPLATLTELCSQYNKTVSMTAVSEGVLKYSRAAKPPEASKLDAIQQKLKDCTAIICLSNVDAAIDYVMPATVIEEDGKQLMVAFLQGAGMSELIDGAKLHKKLKNIYKLANNDIAAAAKMLREDDDVAEEIVNILPEDSCLLVMFQTGEVAAFENSEIEVDRPWGLEYGQTQDSDDEPVAGDNFKGDRTEVVETDDGGLGDLSSDPTPAQTEVKEDPRTGTISRPPNNCPPARFYNSKAKRDVPITLKPGEPWVRCPETIKGRKVTKKENKNWHANEIEAPKDCNSSIPTNWEARPYIPVNMLKNNIEQNGGAKVSTLQTSTATGAVTVSDVSNKHLPVATKVTSARFKDFTDKVLKPIETFNPKTSHDYDAIFNSESERTTLAALAGKLSTDEMALPAAIRLKVCEKDPEMGAFWWGDFQIQARRHAMRVLEVEANGRKLEEENTAMRAEIEKLKAELAKKGTTFDL